MAIETVKKGQGDWQNIFNALIALANVGGGKVEHLADPLSWQNKATGHSNAYTIQLLNGYKLVVLSISNFSSKGLSDGLPVAWIPDNLAPADNNNFIRMAMSQYNVLASTGTNRLDLWKSNTSNADGEDLYGTAIYIAKA